jgi:hypothetical protein
LFFRLPGVDFFGLFSNNTSSFPEVCGGDHTPIFIYRSQFFGLWVMFFVQIDGVFQTSWKKHPEITQKTAGKQSILLVARWEIIG